MAEKLSKCSCQFLGSGPIVYGGPKAGLAGSSFGQVTVRDRRPIPTNSGRGMIKNTPHHIGDVASLVAEVRQMPVAEVVPAANINFLRLFSR